MPFEHPAQKDTTRVPHNGPNPSPMDPGQESSTQVSVDPPPSPHFYAEPLNMEVPEMKSSSEEDLDDMVISSFIRVRKPVATPELPP